MTYQVTDSGSILRLEDNAFIPVDTNNSDYTMYLQWLKDKIVKEHSPVVIAKAISDYEAIDTVAIEGAAGPAEATIDTTEAQ
jgi:hypothetical protein